MVEPTPPGNYNPEPNDGRPVAPSAPLPAAAPQGNTEPVKFVFFTPDYMMKWAEGHAPNAASWLMVQGSVKQMIDKLYSSGMFICEVNAPKHRAVMEQTFLVGKNFELTMTLRLKER